MRKNSWQGWFFLILLFSLEGRGAIRLPERNAPDVDVNIPIRVLLARGTHPVVLHGVTGDLWISSSADRHWKKIGRSAEITWTDDKTASYFTVNGETWKGPQLFLRSGASGLLRQGAGIYHGKIEVVGQRNEVFVVNLLPLEQYLVGLLGSEMSAKWEKEALKAQAVAARSYALYRKAHPRSPHYDLDSSVLDQVYEGVEKESPQTEAAVAETSGEYLTQANRPFPAYFHSRCGGTTESADKVWKTPSSHQGSPSVECPYCLTHPAHWQAAFSTRELLSALHQNPNADLKVALVEANPSGRVRSLLVGNSGQEKLVTANELRGLLGYRRLKSTLFSWRISHQAIVFEGVGAGHGVGLCQWGARFLAQQGKKYREILQHYYPGIALKNIH